MDKAMQKQYFIKCKIHLINVFILMLIVFAFFISNVNAQMFDDDNVAQDVAQDVAQVEETVAPEKKDLQQKSPAVTMPQMFSDIWLFLLPVCFFCLLS